MRIVIVGDGKVGFTLTERLAAEGHDLIVIDNNARTLATLQDSLDVQTVLGNGATYAIQQEAGVQGADLLVACTSMDETNMLCCLVGKKLGVRHMVARVRNPEYAAQLTYLKDELGLSMAVNPEMAAAMEIARGLRFPSAIRFETFARGRAELVECRVAEDSALAGMPLHKLFGALKVRVLVCAVCRDGEVCIPTSEFVLQAGDHIHVTMMPSETAAFFRSLGGFEKRVRNVMIVGGGRVAYYLARQMLDLGTQVKVIELDEARAKDLCDRLPKAMIINGNGTDADLLAEEGLDDMDAFVAVTGMDEENIILSLYARTRIQGRVYTKVDRLPFLGVLGDLGLDSVISPKAITADSIVSYARALDNSRGSNVESLHRLVDGRLSGLEFRIRGPGEYLGRPLKDLSLKPGILIGCIVRKNATIIPSGNDTLEQGDCVVVITANQAISDFSDIFQPRQGR